MLVGLIYDLSPVSQPDLDHLAAFQTLVKGQTSGMVIASVFWAATPIALTVVPATRCSSGVYCYIVLTYGAWRLGRLHLTSCSLTCLSIKLTRPRPQQCRRGVLYFLRIVLFLVNVWLSPADTVEMYVLPDYRSCRRSEHGMVV